MDKDGVEPMALDSEVKEALDEHSERIRQLELTSVKTEQRLVNIEQGQSRMENLILENSKVTLQTLNEVITSKNNLEIAKTEANTKVQTNKNDNSSKVYIQLIVTGGVVITGILGVAKLLFG